MLTLFNSIKRNSAISSTSVRGFASKMKGGSTKNKKDSAGRRLGLKKSGGQRVFENQIIARQRGLTWHAGENVSVGKDSTLHSTKEGKIVFTRDYWRNEKVKIMHVIEEEAPNKHVYPPPPFCYHPELYPELAARNPEPSNLVIKKPKQSTKVKVASIGTPSDFTPYSITISREAAPNHVSTAFANNIKEDYKNDLESKISSQLSIFTSLNAF